MQSVMLERGVGNWPAFWLTWPYAVCHCDCVASVLHKCIGPSVIQRRR